jgi:hypothetical protein
MENRSVDTTHQEMNPLAERSTIPSSQADERAAQSMGPASGPGVNLGFALSPER